MTWDHWMPFLNCPACNNRPRWLSKLELAALRERNLAANAVIADVGCGPGFMSCQIANLVPQGRVIGIDADPDLLKQARRSAAEQGLTHLETLNNWAHEIDLSDDTVDFSYGRFLLQHVPNPLEIVTEMGRITRSGGQIMLLDTDDGALIVHPEPAGLRPTSQSQSTEPKCPGWRPPYWPETPTTLRRSRIGGRGIAGGSIHQRYGGNACIR